VSGNNYMRSAFLRALEARGLRLPDDLALVALRSTLRVRGPVAASADRPAGALLSRLEQPSLPPAASAWRRRWPIAIPAGARVTARSPVSPGPEEAGREQRGGADASADQAGIDGRRLDV
jgi:hypothetical protein